MFIISIIYLWIKALSAMSLRRPTMALLYFTFFSSPFCDVAPTSDCGICFKALYVVSLRRPTVASFPYIYLFTFRGVASDTRSEIIYVLLGFQADYRCFPFTYLVMLIFECTLVNYSWRIHACICYILRPNCLASTFKVLTGLLIWPDADEGDLMDEEFDSESDT